MEGERRPFGAGGAFGIVSLAVDAAFATALVWTYAFDPQTAIFVTVYLVALEGAFRFAMTGAIATMFVLACAYALRDV